MRLKSVSLNRTDTTIGSSMGTGFFIGLPLWWTGEIPVNDVYLAGPLVDDRVRRVIVIKINTGILLSLRVPDATVPDTLQVCPRDGRKAYWSAVGNESREFPSNILRELC
jgi:hypothetical protein